MENGNAFRMDGRRRLDWTGQRMQQEIVVGLNSNTQTRGVHKTRKHKTQTLLECFMLTTKGRLAQRESPSPVNPIPLVITTAACQSSCGSVSCPCVGTCETGARESPMHRAFISNKVYTREVLVEGPRPFVCRRALAATLKARARQGLLQ